MKKISFSVTLDKDLLDWIRKEAKRRHCSISQVVRDMIVLTMGKPK